MKISTKGRYGIRAMVELARNYGNGPLLMSTIAERQEFSRNYLHALLSSLKTAGLVRSVRGSGGGYILAKAPAKINLWEILRVLEGSLALVECVDDGGICSRSSKCRLRGIWRSLSDSLEKQLKEINLQDLMDCKE
jgi:Rrf2 family protein